MSTEHLNEEGQALDPADLGKVVEAAVAEALATGLPVLMAGVGPEADAPVVALVAIPVHLLEAFAVAAAAMIAEEMAGGNVAAEASESFSGPSGASSRAPWGGYA